MSCDTELQALHTQHVKYTTNLKSFFFSKRGNNEKKFKPSQYNSSYLPFSVAVERRFNDF